MRIGTRKQTAGALNDSALRMLCGVHAAGDKLEGLYLVDMPLLQCCMFQFQHLLGKLYLLHLWQLLVHQWLALHPQQAVHLLQSAVQLSKD
jgi:hypothetical protein